MSTKPRFAAIVVSLLLMTLITPDSYAADKGEDLYKQTFQLYKSLAGSQEKISDKEIWDTIARAFYSIYINYPQSDKAPNALFISGKMYEEMGERFGSKDDLETALASAVRSEGASLLDVRYSQLLAPILEPPTDPS